MSSTPPSVPHATPAPAAPLRHAWLAKLLLAHAIAYPLGIAWAAASIPPLIHLWSDELARLDDANAVARFLLRQMAWPGGAAFALPHVTVLLWILGRDERRGRRAFVVSAAVVLVLAALVGGAGWLWLVLR